MTGTQQVAYVVACSAPPALDLARLTKLIIEEGWTTYAILTPTAATWVDVDALAEASGHPVRVDPRRPGEPDPLPPADVVIAAPLTFNSLNKWAAGISDTLALGLLNEALGLDAPIIVAPCIKKALRRHPAYKQNADRLRSAGAIMFDPDRVFVDSTNVSSFRWDLLVPT
ncbi:flavoprotein [Pseudonocardia petroleophila]|uniref:Flavoprotein n=1 Tax=Pseudonocardia petroleophila TaxID=37331 RepID=A0A7G7MIK9_9PSEU|nr:flavoprotein [Pseudonocardia petroleophila]QNG52620.1 flavoprotein [Pseudonocardia petroleophila]